MFLLETCSPGVEGQYRGDEQLPFFLFLVINFIFFVCFTDIFIYLLFISFLSPAEPIGHVNLTGNTWLKHGELVELTAVCSGSPTIGYCKRNYWGVHNITGESQHCLRVIFLEAAKWSRMKEKNCCWWWSTLSFFLRSREMRRGRDHHDQHLQHLHCVLLPAERNPHHSAHLVQRHLQSCLPHHHQHIQWLGVIMIDWKENGDMRGDSSYTEGNRKRV